MIKDTLYAQYLKSRLDQEILENENGFLVYKQNGKECYLAEFYVKPESRRAGVAKQLLNQLKNISSEAGCEYIIATVHQFDKHASQTLSAAFALGFKLHLAHNNTISIILNIKEAQNGIA